MPSLSQVTLETRAILKWLAIILGALLVLFLILKVKEIIFPAPPPGPTVSFGKLPSIDFPSTNGKTFTYSVDTISGAFPNFSQILKVFKMEEISPDLLSLARAQQLAKGIGFESNPSEVSENVYQWNDSKTGNSLTMNIHTFNFNYSTNFLFKSSLSTFKDTNQAITLSKDFLKNIDLYPKDTDENNIKTSFLTVKNYKLASASALDSQVVRINFYQAAVDQLPIYYPDVLISPMNFLVAGSNPKVVGANFFYQKISNISATYPIKTAQEAFNDLKNGKALISLTPNTSKIAIKKVSLGYYVAERKQMYLLPVVVFDGDNFEALVSAVRDEWSYK